MTFHRSRSNALQLEETPNHVSLNRSTTDLNALKSPFNAADATGSQGRHREKQFKTQCLYGEKICISLMWSDLGRRLDERSTPPGDLQQ